MPIYAYRCDACGYAKDVLQKVSDPLLTACPACGTEAFRKQVTAAGFQLKGSGWYVTDFRGGDSNKKAGADDKAEAPNSDAPATDGKAGDAKVADAKPADAGPAPAADRAAPAPAAAKAVDKPAAKPPAPPAGGTSAGQ